MYSVTERIRMIKQPVGGYINKKNLSIIQLDDGIVLNEKENIHASLIGSAVDYMTRFMMGAEKKKAFAISLKGAEMLDASKEAKKSAMKNAAKLLLDIKGLDKKSISNVCKLVGYDVCFRVGIMEYKPVEEINPDIDTIENIITMINRSLAFWKDYGPIIKDGFTFKGGYTNIISKGDGDFLTKDTLWDFKVLKGEPNSKHTLQLLVYYIMGKHSIYSEFDSIDKLGIYNPRLNKIYTIDIDSISTEVMKDVSKIIGYAK